MLIMYYLHLQLGIAIRDSVVLCSVQMSNDNDWENSMDHLPYLYTLIPSLAFPYLS